MNTTITPEAIKAKHQDATAEEKKILEKLFPEIFFDFRMINTLQDALNYHGLNIASLAFYMPEMHDKYAKRIQATIHLDLIADAIRGNDEPIDFSNSNQKKWYCWFEYSAAAGGFGFRASDFNYTRTITDVSARRSFLSREKAEHFGKTFIELINQELL